MPCNIVIKCTIVQRKDNGEGVCGQWSIESQCYTSSISGRHFAKAGNEMVCKVSWGCWGEDMATLPLSLQEKQKLLDRKLAPHQDSITAE